jgi:hypothetical protein
MSEATEEMSKAAEAHAMAVMWPMSHLNDDLAAKFPQLSDQVQQGWKGKLILSQKF